ncbi:MAG: ABC transporter permease [Rhodocyclaceae bacterium]|nr:ABC transporter permease [Rhodocyclaceae bacterium]MBK6908183.1 ABC transporter permease [Rhodocyclaceae bacterium]
MIWLLQHRQALALALLRLKASPLNSLLSILAMGVALALPAGGQLLVDNGVRLARSSAPAPQISLYLRMDADSAQVAGVRERLAANRDIASSQFLSRDETLQRFKGSEGLRDVIDVLPQNPFPHAFVVTPRDDSPASMDLLAVELRALPAVDHVQLDSDWVRRLDALLRFLKSAVAVLALMLGTGLVAITFNITRTQVLMQRDEIVVSELLGATASYVRRPFLYFGTLLGLLGGVLAWCVVLAASVWLGQPLQEVALLYGLSAQLTTLSAAESIGLVALAAALGWLGTALSLGQHLSRS